MTPPGVYAPQADTFLLARALHREALTEGMDVLEQACRPRDAYFGPAEAVPPDRAAGRVSAEMITPYPPGIPAVLPGERPTEPVLHYLRTGLQGGMNLPDASDPELRTIRVRR
jgi:lysine decarboxylase